MSSKGKWEELSSQNRGSFLSSQNRRRTRIKGRRKEEDDDDDGGECYNSARSQALMVPRIRGDDAIAIPLKACLEVVNAIVAGRALWGPVLAFAHGEGDKIIVVEDATYGGYKFPCDKDGVFGKYNWGRHARRIFKDVEDILTYYKLWTHKVSVENKTPVSGTATQSTEEKNIQLRDRHIRNTVDRNQMPTGTNLVMYDRGTLSTCPLEWLDQDEELRMPDTALFMSPDGCGTSVWIGATAEFAHPGIVNHTLL